MNIQAFFTEEEKQNIDQAVAEAEKKTSAEIVPVLTDTSGRYDRAEDLFGLLFSIGGVITLWTLFQRVDTSVAWAGERNPHFAYSLCLVVATIVGFFIVGTVLASKVWFIRNLFTPASIKKQCLERGARQAFYEFNLSKTKGASGVLIYISLFERMVYVLGDISISEKLSNDDFAEVKDRIIEGFRQGKRGEGLCAAIEMCGQKLAKDFPIQKDDTNELPNCIRIFQQSL